MRYLTAGESHGPQLTTIIEGVPAGLPLLAEDINEELARRQKGHGRGRRMQIEKDQVQIVSGVRHGITLGSPITLVVENKDFTHWTKIMGAIKYNHRDMRNVLERSSARETTVRVAAGAVAKKVLKELGVEVGGHVLELGGVVAENTSYESLEELREKTEVSPVRCLDKNVEKTMMEAIDTAKENGDSIGGVVEVIVEGMPVGVGSYTHYDNKLDAKLAAAIMSINAFKGAEIGIGFEAARKPGSEVHDEIVWDIERGYTRRTNNAGGFEGGMTTGMPVIVRGVMKPIPTLYKPLNSVDIETKEVFAASIERSDSCAVPAASVVAESVVAWELASALVNQFGQDNMEVIKKNISQHQERARVF